MRGRGQDGGSRSMLAAVGLCLARVGEQGLWRGALLARVATVQLEAMSTMSNANGARITVRQITDTFLPVTNRNWAGDQRRTFIVGIVDTLHQGAS